MGSLRDLNRGRNEPEDRPIEKEDLGGLPLPFSSKWFLDELGAGIFFDGEKVVKIKDIQWDHLET
jgi:hypothetical protein